MNKINGFLLMAIFNSAFCTAQEQTRVHTMSDQQNEAPTPDVAPSTVEQSETLEQESFERKYPHAHAILEKSSEELSDYERTIMSYALGIWLQLTKKQLGSPEQRERVFYAYLEHYMIQLEEMIAAQAQENDIAAQNDQTEAFAA